MTSIFSDISVSVLFDVSNCKDSAVSFCFNFLYAFLITSGTILLIYSLIGYLYKAVQYSKRISVSALINGNCFKINIFSMIFYCEKKTFLAHFFDVPV